MKSGLKKKNYVALCLLLTLFCILVFWSGIAAADTVISSGTTSDNLKYQVLQDANGSNYVRITEYTGYDSIVEVPETIEGYTVRKIGEGAFYQKTFLLSKVFLPDSITEIEGAAFRNNTSNSLSVLNIPASLQIIGDYAFAGLKLPNITLPTGVTSIGAHAFEGCSAATSITIPNTVTSIGISAFYRCRAVTSISIPNGIETLGSDMFRDCTALESVTLPASLQELGSFAFFGCSALAQITLPEGITTIGDYAFSGCSSLAEITIPSTVTTLGTAVLNNFGEPFRGTIHVAEGNPSFYTDAEGDVLYSRDGTLLAASYYTTGEYTVPSGVTKIGSYAFSGCELLTGVTLPQGITEIQESVFYGCDGLSHINLPEGLETIWGNVFYGCSSLTELTIPSTLTTIGYSSFSRTGITRLTIAPGMTDIPKSAFSSMTSLRELSLPDGLIHIGETAFSGCTALEEVSLPDTVTTIDYSAFSGCTSLQEFRFPDGVNYINRRVLYGCTGLKSVILPANLRSIDDEAFYNAKQIETLVLPSGTKFIYTNSFKGMALKSINIPASVTTLQSSALYGIPTVYKASSVNYTFSGNVNIFNYQITEGEAQITGYSYSGYSTSSLVLPESIEGCPLTGLLSGTFTGTALRTLTLPQTLTDIAEGAITASNLTLLYVGSAATVSCPDKTDVIYYEVQNDEVTITSLRSGMNGDTASSTSLTIPNTFYGYPVTAIGSDAFRADSAKQTIKLPSGLTQIGEGAFAQSAITGIELPETVTHIGANAFENAASLAQINLPDGVTVIPDGAFKGTALTQVPVNPNITTIGAQAFENCAGIEVLELPVSISSVGTDAFAGCANITRACVPSTLNLEFGESTEVFRFSQKNGNLGIDSYTGTASTVEIPETIVGGTVKSLAVGAMAGKPNMETLIIPPTVTSIGSYQQYSSTSSYYFGYCPALKVVYHSGILLEEHTRLNNTECAYLSITYKVTDGEAALAACSGHILGTVDLVLPAYFGSVPLTTIGANADGAGVIHDKPEVTSITLPETVKTINEYSFEYNTGLKRVLLNEGLESIGQSAFMASPIEEITLPSTLKTIGAGAFAGNSSDNNRARVSGTLVIPAGLESIGSGNSLPIADAYEVETGSTHFSSENGLLYDAARTTLLLVPPVNGEEITLRDGLTEIGGQAFTLVENAVIHIPDSVTKINGYVFRYVTNSTVYMPAGVELASLAIDTFRGNCTYYTETAISLDNYYDSDFYSNSRADRAKIYQFARSGDTYRFVRYCGYDDDVTIPETYRGLPVTAIANYAFSGKSALKTLSIPDTVTEIGNYAFNGQSELTALTLPNGVTSISETAFNGCPAVITCVAASDTARALGTIGHSFVDPTYPGLDLLWQGEALQFTVTDPSRTLYVLPEGVASISTGSAESGDGGEESGSGTVPSGGFTACSALTSIVIPASVTSISNDAFAVLPTTVYAPEGSFAQQWAIENNIFTFDPANSPAVLPLAEGIRLEVGESIDVADLFRPEASYLLSDASLQFSVVAAPGSVLGEAGSGPVSGSVGDDAGTPDTMQSVASLSGSVLTGENTGEAVLIASLTEQPSVTAHIPVYVCKGVTSISLPSRYTAAVGTVLELEVSSYEPEDAYTGFVWTVEEETAAEIEENILTVTAEQAVNTNVTVTSWNGTSATTSLRIYVPVIRSVTLGEVNERYGVGETLQLTATVRDNIKSYVNQLVTFSSDNEAVATVDENGLVTFLTAGTVTLTATAGEMSDSATIEVSVPVESFALAEHETMFAGETFTLETTDLTPADAYGTMTYTSSDESVATVDEAGVVSGVAAGTAQITAVSWNGVEASISVQVFEPITDVTLSAQTERLEVNETTALTATVQCGEVTLQNRFVVFSSSDESVVTVDETGLATAVGYGTATVTATTVNGLTASVEIHVSQAVTSFAVAADEYMFVGDTMTCEITDLEPSEAYGTMMWTSSDESIATVDETGLVTAVSAGSVQITAQSWNGVTQSVDVRVYDTITSISIDPVPEDMYVLDDVQLTVRVMCGEEEHINEFVTFSSSDESVLTVTQDGLVTSEGYGEATITATAENGMTASVTIGVRIEVEDFSLGEGLVLEQGEEQIVEINGLVPDDAYSVMTWSSSDETVASVDETGKVTALEPGSATISAKSWNGLVRRTTVTVTAPEIGSIELSASAQSVARYEALQLSTKVYSTRGALLADVSLTFESSDEAVVKVEADGSARALAAGTAVLSASAPNGVSASVEVTVRDLVTWTLPAALTSIEEEAFAGDTFEAIVIPAGCTSIGARAFANCENLRAVIFEDGSASASIAADAFEGCTDVCFVIGETAGGAVETYAQEHGIEVVRQ